MNDTSTKIQELKDMMASFVREREWNQFHSPKNVSMKLAIEAAELMEKFVWLDAQQSFDEVAHNRQEVEDELADIFILVLTFCNVTGIDVSTAMRNKLVQMGEKYPVEKAKGKATKYTKL